jgi:hypothetical protein
MKVGHERIDRFWIGRPKKWLFRHEQELKIVFFIQKALLFIKIVYSYLSIVISKKHIFSSRIWFKFQIVRKHTKLCVCAEVFSMCVFTHNCAYYLMPGLQCCHLCNPSYDPLFHPFLYPWASKLRWCCPLKFDPMIKPYFPHPPGKMATAILCLKGLTQRATTFEKYRPRGPLDISHRWLDDKIGPDGPVRSKMIGLKGQYIKKGFFGFFVSKFI